MLPQCLLQTSSLFICDFLHWFGSPQSYREVWTVQLGKWATVSIAAHATSARLYQMWQGAAQTEYTSRFFCWGFGESWANMFELFDLYYWYCTYLYNLVAVVLNSYFRWFVHSGNMSVWKLGDPFCDPQTLTESSNIHHDWTQEMSSVGVHRESMGEKTTFNALDNARVQLCFGQGLFRYWSSCCWMRSRTTWDVYAAFCPT